MERESNPMQALCRSGCGFYGNPATDGLCSLCFKEALKKKQQPPVTSAGAPAPQQQQTPPPSSQQQQHSLASLMDTATGQPTVPCIPTVASATSLAAATSDASASAAISTCSLSPKEVAAATSADESGGESSNAADQEDDGKDDKDAKKKKNRCAACRKKVGLTGFQCRCGGLYCAVHRYSDKHECSFDYREMGAQEIRRNNPVVVGEKIQKI